MSVLGNARGKLSPAAIQIIIWGTAVAITVAVAIFAFVRDRAVPPADQPIEALGPAEPAPSSSAEPETPAGERSGEPQPPPIIPDANVPDDEPPNRPREEEHVPPAGSGGQPRAQSALTEDQFVQASALMVLAREAFADTPEGRESLEKACDRILMDREIDRDDFEAYTGKLAADDKRRTRIQNRILERVDQLQALEVTAGVSPTPRAPSARR